MRKVRRLFYLFMLCAAPFCGKAQELNARITVNGDKIATANKQIFTTLQNSLNTLSDGHFFFRIGCFAIFYRFGSSITHDCFFFGWINISFRSFLSYGINAVVLENSTLYSSGCTGYTCLCKAKLYGCRYGRHKTGIYNFVDSDDCLFHY